MKENKKRRDITIKLVMLYSPLIESYPQINCHIDICSVSNIDGASSKIEDVFS
jgi:hypothetical protein